MAKGSSRWERSRARYIGSIEHQHDRLWVYDDKKSKMVNRDIKFVPGLYKIFDEARILFFSVPTGLVRRRR